MHHLTHHIHDLYLGQGRNIFQPGKHDPAWLIRAAEHDRILNALKADARNAGKAPIATRGIVARLRGALSRA